MDKWIIALKEALYNDDLFIAENSISMHEDSKTNISDIIDYIISSPAIYNNIQELSLNNDFSSDHSAILVNFLTNIHCVKGVPIRVFSGLYFPAFALNTERCGVSLHILPECEKYGPKQLRI